MNSLAPHDFRPDVADAGVDLTGISGAAALSPDQVPAYLRDHYWWAYVHPNAVRVFERQWLVNAIVWGNYPRLRDLALDTLGDSLTGRTLQIACAYGDLTNLLAERIAADGGKLDVVDVLEVQTENLRGKLAPGLPVRLINMDSSDLDYDEATFDRTLLFFLLHEQPEDVRRRTIAEALRVTRPGGKLVIVDYARPYAWNPLRWLFQPVLARLEPFALDLWRNDLSAWTPPAWADEASRPKRFFGGLYQMVTLTR
ncbi:MAG: rhodoquinone biosynthesis methyltransferase RquA [Beijerinckiaceae bacterium]